MTSFEDMDIFTFLLLLAVTLECIQTAGSRFPAHIASDSKSPRSRQPSSLHTFSNIAPDVAQVNQQSSLEHFGTRQNQPHSDARYGIMNPDVNHISDRHASPAQVSHAGLNSRGNNELVSLLLQVLNTPITDQSYSSKTAGRIASFHGHASSPQLQSFVYQGGALSIEPTLHHRHDLQHTVLDSPLPKNQDVYGGNQIGHTGRNEAIAGSTNSLDGKASTGVQDQALFLLGDAGYAPAAVAVSSGGHEGIVINRDPTLTASGADLRALQSVLSLSGMNQNYDTIRSGSSGTQQNLANGGHSRQHIPNSQSHQSDLSVSDMHLNDRAVASGSANAFQGIAAHVDRGHSEQNVPDVPALPVDLSLSNMNPTFQSIKGGSLFHETQAQSEHTPTFAGDLRYSAGIASHGMFQQRLNITNQVVPGQPSEIRTSRHLSHFPIQGSFGHQGELMHHPVLSPYESSGNLGAHHFDNLFGQPNGLGFSEQSQEFLNFGDQMGMFGNTGSNMDFGGLEGTGHMMEHGSIGNDLFPGHLGFVDTFGTMGNAAHTQHLVRELPKAQVKAATKTHTLKNESNYSEGPVTTVTQKTNVLPVPVLENTEHEIKTVEHKTTATPQIIEVKSQTISNSQNAKNPSLKPRTSSLASSDPVTITTEKTPSTENGQSARKGIHINSMTKRKTTKITSTIHKPNPRSHAKQQPNSSILFTTPKSTTTSNTLRRHTQKAPTTIGSLLAKALRSTSARTSSTTQSGVKGGNTDIPLDAVIRHFSSSLLRKLVDLGYTFKDLSRLLPTSSVKTVASLSKQEGGTTPARTFGSSGRTQSTSKFIHSLQSGRSGNFKKKSSIVASEGMTATFAPEITIAVTTSVTPTLVKAVRTTMESFSQSNNSGVSQKRITKTERPTSFEASTVELTPSMMSTASNSIQNLQSQTYELNSSKSSKKVVRNHDRHSKSKIKTGFMDSELTRTPSRSQQTSKPTHLLRLTPPNVGNFHADHAVLASAQTQLITSTKSSLVNQQQSKHAESRTNQPHAKLSTIASISALGVPDYMTTVSSPSETLHRPVAASSKVPPKQTAATISVGHVPSLISPAASIHVQTSSNYKSSKSLPGLTGTLPVRSKSKFLNTTPYMSKSSTSIVGPDITTISGRQKAIQNVEVKTLQTTVRSVTGGLKERQGASISSVGTTRPNSYPAGRKHKYQTLMPFQITQQSTPSQGFVGGSGPMHKSSSTSLRGSLSTITQSRTPVSSSPKETILTIPSETATASLKPTEHPTIRQRDSSQKISSHYNGLNRVTHPNFAQSKRKQVIPGPRHTPTIRHQERYIPVSSFPLRKHSHKTTNSEASRLSPSSKLTTEESRRRSQALSMDFNSRLQALIEKSRLASPVPRRGEGSTSPSPEHAVSTIAPTMNEVKSSQDKIVSLVVTPKPLVSSGKSRYNAGTDRLSLLPPVSSERFSEDSVGSPAYKKMSDNGHLNTASRKPLSPVVKSGIVDTIQPPKSRSISFLKPAAEERINIAKTAPSMKPTTAVNREQSVGTSMKQYKPLDKSAILSLLLKHGLGADLGINEGNNPYQLSNTYKKDSTKRHQRVYFTPQMLQRLVSKHPSLPQKMTTAQHQSSYPVHTQHAEQSSSVPRVFKSSILSEVRGTTGNVSNKDHQTLKPGTIEQSRSPDAQEFQTTQSMPKIHTVGQNHVFSERTSTMSKDLTSDVFHKQTLMPDRSNINTAEKKNKGMQHSIPSMRTVSHFQNTGGVLGVKEHREGKSMPSSLLARLINSGAVSDAQGKSMAISLKEANVQRRSRPIDTTPAESQSLSEPSVRENSNGLLGGSVITNTELKESLNKEVQSGTEVQGPDISVNVHNAKTQGKTIPQMSPQLPAQLLSKMASLLAQYKSLVNPASVGGESDLAPQSSTATRVLPDNNVKHQTRMDLQSVSNLSGVQSNSKVPFDLFSAQNSREVSAEIGELNQEQSQERVLFLTGNEHFRSASTKPGSPEFFSLLGRNMPTIGQSGSISGGSANPDILPQIGMNIASVEQASSVEGGHINPDVFSQMENINSAEGFRGSIPGHAFNNRNFDLFSQIGKLNSIDGHIGSLVDHAAANPNPDLFSEIRKINSIERHTGSLADPAAVKLNPDLFSQIGKSNPIEGHTGSLADPSGVNSNADLFSQIGKSNSIKRLSGSVTDPAGVKSNPYLLSQIGKSKSIEGRTESLVDSSGVDSNPYLFSQIGKSNSIERLSGSVTDPAGVKSNPYLLPQLGKSNSKEGPSGSVTDPAGVKSNPDLFSQIGKSNSIEGPTGSVTDPTGVKSNPNFLSQIRMSKTSEGSTGSSTVPIDGTPNSNINSVKNTDQTQPGGNLNADMFSRLAAMLSQQGSPQGDIGRSRNVENSFSLTSLQTRRGLQQGTQNPSQGLSSFKNNIHGIPLHLLAAALARNGMLRRKAQLSRSRIFTQGESSLSDPVAPSEAAEAHNSNLESVRTFPANVRTNPAAVPFQALRIGQRLPPTRLLPSGGYVSGIDGGDIVVKTPKGERGFDLADLMKEPAKGIVNPNQA